VRVNLFYNIKKVFNKLEVFGLQRHAIRSNVFLLNKSNKKIKSILLYFPDYEMMHLGDHLFFEPLARHLKKTGYQICISPIELMEFYFKDLGYEICRGADFSRFDLIISRVEFLRILKNNGQILLVDTASSKINKPLCNDMIEKVSQFLKVPHDDYNPVPAYLRTRGDVYPSSIANNNYILFNNYIDSGSIRSGAKHQRVLLDFIVELKERTGYKVIHTGSKIDKIRDNLTYDFVDIDVRGLISIQDLFELCALDNAKFNVSFDGLQMHLFSMKKKKSFVLFRGRILKRNERYIKRFVNPPFSTNMNNLIEYIG